MIKRCLVPTKPEQPKSSKTERVSLRSAGALYFWIEFSLNWQYSGQPNIAGGEAFSQWKDPGHFILYSMATGKSVSMGIL